MAGALRPLATGRDWLSAPLPHPARHWTIPIAFGGEHGVALGQIEDLRGRASLPAPDLDSLRADCRALAEGLHRHEAVESQLMEDAAYVEYGVAD